jgi:peptide chain release factor subunit 1
MPAGGENGFSQAIELSADTLANVKFVQEKRLISKFFDEISQDTSKYVFGVADTLQCLEMGAVETLVVWEDLQVYRYTLMNSTSGNSFTVVTQQPVFGRLAGPVQCCTPVCI